MRIPLNTIRTTPLIVASLVCAAPALAEAPTGEQATQEQEITIPVGHSQVIEPGWRVSEVAVADDEIADVQVVNPQRVVIMGKSFGSTDVTMWDESGESWRARVYVAMDMESLKRDLRVALPGADLDVTQSQDVLVVTGELRRAEDADALERFLIATDVPYANLTRVAGPQQVMIRVRVAEASRVAIRALGINAFHSGEDFFGGSTIGGNPNGIDIGVPEGAPSGSGLPFQFNQPTSIGDAVTLFAGFPSIDFQMFVEALEDNQYLRMLAEPTLVALSGEKASFLAGGEFPIPVVQGGGVGGGSSVTVEYKEFGVRLNFKPTVLGDGTIKLQVAPEVSDLSDAGAVTIQGFRIPSLATRRADTTLHMRSGQTFAMAGLINRNVLARSQSTPGLGNIPILGALFRSVRYEQRDTELIVLCTVEVVEPVDELDTPPLPGSTHSTPDSWELYANGQIHGNGKARRPTAPMDWAKQRGLDRLEGPGAWAEYGQKREPRRAPTPDERELILEPLRQPDEEGSG